VPPAPGATERGWGNPVLGAKWRFYDNESSKLSFAFRPEIQFPVSDNREARGLGTARVSYGAGLLMRQETGFGALLANLTVANLTVDRTTTRMMPSTPPSAARSPDCQSHRYGMSPPTGNLRSTPAS